jgi:hypothetical protein
LKKRVGILTLSASDNCGSLLQAYALQEVLRCDYNCDVEIINLITKEAKAVYNVFSPEFYKHPKKTLFTICYLRSICKQKKDYNQFRNKYLKLTMKTYETVKDLQLIQNDYDVLCVGSDQVWNVNMTDYSEAYFLPWSTKARKMSYAASLGRTQKLEPVARRKLKKWLEDFEYISVREMTGYNTISELTEKKVNLLADPTLLLERGKWENIAGERYVKEEYIFFYSWSYPDEKMNLLVERYAKEHNLPVYVINSTKWYKFRPQKFGFNLYELSGPSAFLNLMLYAKYVFVQSFHGVVFANIFQKRFFFLNEQERGKIDFRAGNFLDLLGESSQVIHEWNDFREAEDSDLTYSSSGLIELINQSKKYLEDAIRG